MDKHEFLSRLTPPKKITLDDGSEHFIRKLSQADVEVMTKRYTAQAANAAEGLRYAVVKGLVNEAGERIFADSDLDALKATDFDVIQQLAGEIVDYAGLNRPKKQ